MTGWWDEAACQGQAPDFDFEFKDIAGNPLALVEQAKFCQRCPVAAQCEAWADSESAANKGKGDLGFVAAGYAYVHRGTYGKRAIRWGECASDGCNKPTVANEHRKRKYCSLDCYRGTVAS